jgi:hypothetical protein
MFPKKHNHARIEGDETPIFKQHGPLDAYDDNWTQLDDLDRW